MPLCVESKREMLELSMILQTREEEFSFFELAPITISMVT